MQRRIVLSWLVILLLSLLAAVPLLAAGVPYDALDWTKPSLNFYDQASPTATTPSRDYRVAF